jgi:hypothetical protein
MENSMLDYNDNQTNYDHLIGATVRDENMMPIGKITVVEYAYDKWRHFNACAILDSGRRISCRALHSLA